MKAQISHQTDQFVSEFYSLVIIPVISKKILPLVDKFVTEVLSKNTMSPKSKITIT